MHVNSFQMNVWIMSSSVIEFNFLLFGQLARVWNDLPAWEKSITSVGLSVCCAFVLRIILDVFPFKSLRKATQTFRCRKTQHWTVCPLDQCGFSTIHLTALHKKLSCLKSLIGLIHVCFHGISVTAQLVQNDKHLRMFPYYWLSRLSKSQLRFSPTSLQQINRKP